MFVAFTITFFMIKWLIVSCISLFFGIVHCSLITINLLLIFHKSEFIFVIKSSGIFICVLLNCAVIIIVLYRGSPLTLLLEYILVVDLVFWCSAGFFYTSYLGAAQRKLSLNKDSHMLCTFLLLIQL